MYPRGIAASGVISIACLLVSACGGGGSGGGGGSVTVQPPPGGAVGASTLQEVVNRNRRRGVDGIAVTVLKADSAPESYTSGIRSRAGGDPMDATAPFKIASVSKLFIAAATVQIIGQGALSLEDTLAQHLPDIAPRIANADAITLRSLLQHRSGVPDFDSQAGFSWRNTHTDIDKVLSYALDLPADFAPDARFEYSNTNYLLLGKILDSVLGYSHRDYIQSQILDPLGMRDTWHVQREAAEPLVRGYWDDVDYTNSEYNVPGGSMVSNGVDVSVFIQALATGGLFEEEAQRTYGDVYWYQHSGWLPGYQTIAGYESFPGVAIVVQINNTGGASEDVIGDVYEQVHEILRR